MNWSHVIIGVMIIKSLRTLVGIKLLTGDSAFLNKFKQFSGF